MFESSSGRFVSAMHRPNNGMGATERMRLNRELGLGLGGVPGVDVRPEVIPRTVVVAEHLADIIEFPQTARILAEATDGTEATA